jgi:pimeloyl-ACP methyl ester carboxylesterase
MKACDMKALLPRVRCPVLFVVGDSDLKTHERPFLKLLGPRARHLVIKGGLHTWPYQPAVLPQYRAAAMEFADGVGWGPAGAEAAGGAQG